MASIDKTWFVVVNPHAGSGKTISEWKKAEVLMKKTGMDYVCAESQYCGHIPELVGQAASEGYRKFAAVGGDGTAHETFNGLLRFYDAQPQGSVRLEDFALAVIPIGSGNDWIKTHGIPRNHEKVLRLMKEESFVKQDVARVSTVETRDPEEAFTAAATRVEYMLNGSGIGFDSRVCDMVNIQKSEGKTHRWLYAKALLQVIKGFYSFPVSVWADGKELYSGECFSIAAGTCKYSGGGMRQLPGAVPDDFLLDLMIVPKMPICIVLPKLIHLFTGKLEKYRGLIEFSKNSTVVVVPMPGSKHEPELIEIDGETVGRIPCRIDVLQHQIRVLSAAARR